jgi:hypothetical protein
MWELQHHKTYKLWLVWELTTAGAQGLRAICTSHEKAKVYLKAAQREKKVLRARIEEAFANHMYSGWGRLKD